MVLFILMFDGYLNSISNRIQKHIRLETKIDLQNNRFLELFLGYTGRCLEALHQQITRANSKLISNKTKMKFLDRTSYEAKFILTDNLVNLFDRATFM